MCKEGEGIKNLSLQNLKISLDKATWKNDIRDTRG
jgi:hypothetical protein